MSSRYRSVNLIAGPACALLLSLSSALAFAAPPKPRLPKGSVQSCCAPRSSRCTGSADCTACTNCSRCAYCGAGGTCGVCAGTATGRGYSESSRSGHSSNGSSSTSGSSSRWSSTVASGPTPAPRPTLASLPSTFVARVVGITDGDTVTLLTGSRQRIKTRLWGVDAPEKRQAFGIKSRQCLSNLVYGQTVNVSKMDIDKYGRMVAMLRFKGKDMGKEQITRGMAWWYKSFAPKQNSYRDAQDEAKSGKLGLWIDKAPVEPWRWRQSN